jgi:TPR repeat protein
MHACRGVQLEFTLFFNANAQALFLERLGQKPSDAEGLVELPPDVDVIAEVILTGANSAQYKIPKAAKIVRLIKTSDPRVRQGEEIPIKFVFTSCGPNHRSGSQGTIAAKVGTDIEGHLVLCLFSRRFNDGHLDSPSNSEYISECNPSAIKEARRIKQAAEGGDVKAQIALGLRYEEGKSVRPNNAEALKWLHLAAKSENVEAIYQLGAKYRRDKNDKEALKWFKLAAEKGHEYAKAILEGLPEEDAIKGAAENGNAEAQYKLGQKYDSKQKFVEALKFYKLAAAQGQLEAAKTLGSRYCSGWGGVEIDRAEGIRWYRIAAEKGDIETQCELGMIYDYLGAYNEALQWYKIAADQENVMAMSRIGVLYQYGRGVEQNDAEAVKWYRSALGLGYTDALEPLVEVYLQGRVLVEKGAEVETWLRLSAGDGNSAALFGLGRMYQLGERVEQNDAEAIKWYLLAADQKNKDAINALAEMELQGRGIAANYAEVETLLRLAAEKRIRGAAAALNALEK